MPTPPAVLFRFHVARAPQPLVAPESAGLRPLALTSFEMEINSAHGSRKDLRVLAQQHLDKALPALLGESAVLQACAKVMARLEREAGAAGRVSRDQVDAALREADVMALLDARGGRDALLDRLWSALTALHCAPGSDVAVLLALTRSVRALTLVKASSDEAAALALRAPLALPLSRIRHAFSAPPAPQGKQGKDPVRQALAQAQQAVLSDLTLAQGLVNKLEEMTAARTQSVKARPLDAPLSAAERDSLNAAQRQLLASAEAQGSGLDTLLPQLQLSLRDKVALSAVGRQAHMITPHLLVSPAQQNQQALLSLAQISTPELTTLLGSNLWRSGLSADLYATLPGVIPLPSMDQITEQLRARVRPLGVIDLRLVQTTLLHYQLGEVAHVENVLASEFRERQHSREDTVEETILTERETTQENERNLESTERFEMQQEVSKVVSEQMQVTAGVNVSGYGPGFSVGVNVGFSYGRSQQDSQRAATQYAKEVVEKCREKVETRVREQRQSTRRVVVQERNTHRFDNTAAGSTHQVGVYRFVDKVHEAQLYNYGRRMMFEFMVPEPAAALRQVTQQTSAKPAPVPALTVRPNELNAANYQQHAAMFGARDITPPPPATLDVAVVLARSSSSPSGADTAPGPLLLSGEIDIPAGYSPVSFRISYASAGNGDGGSVQWSVGEWSGTGPLASAATPARDIALTLPPRLFSRGRPIDKVPAWVLFNPTRQATASLVLACVREESALQAWQSATFQKIQEAYEVRLADTLDANRRLESQQRRGVTASQPQINRRRERDELMRGAITVVNSMLLQGEYFDSVSVTDDGVLIDVDDALREGQTVRFFQGAFEWDNMTYELFPYFWGQRERWPEMLMASHEDPKHEEFLRSGFARVLVPVTPGKEANVLNVLSLGLSAVFDGAREAVIDDPDYLALLADLDEPLEPPVQEGDPWRVVLPTSLVKLQLAGEEEGLGVRGTT